MSDSKGPDTEEELIARLRELIGQEHDYNTSTDALHDGTLAAFHYLGHMLGNSGFQASIAVLGLIGKVNGINGPYAIIKGENMLYPQYKDPIAQAAELTREWQPWAAEQAAIKLREYEEDRCRGQTHPDVVEHWRRLVAQGQPPNAKSVS